MVKIRFNKIVHTLSITKGERYIGVININEVEEYIKSSSVFKRYIQADDDYYVRKPITMTKIEGNRIRLAVGGMLLGHIDKIEFENYMNDEKLDIKEFENLMSK